MPSICSQTASQISDSKISRIHHLTKSSRHSTLILHMKPILGSLILIPFCLLLMAALVAPGMAAPELATNMRQTHAPTILPAISPIRVITPGAIKKYAKFEIAFDVSSNAANPYFPFDENPPVGIEPATGITVNAYFLAPEENDWAQAKMTPCFYYQPVAEVGVGVNISLLPSGTAEWRCRFAPEEIGTWQYKINVSDSDGLVETAVQPFTSIHCTAENCQGFVKVSPQPPNSSNLKRRSIYHPTGEYGTKQPI